MSRRMTQEKIGEKGDVHNGLAREKRHSLSGPGLPHGMAGEN